MKHKTKNTNQIQKKNTETYIPYITGQTQEHDIFIDLLSYERRNGLSKNDIWNYEYV